MTENILIIKLGAMGDVLRTTVLLRALNGNIYWVTKKENAPILDSSDGLIKKIIDINEAEVALQDVFFDLVLCLDDDLSAARLSGLINKKRSIGSFLNLAGKPDYTDSSCEWFDMGLISKLGKEKADYLKKHNKRAYQEIIFDMIGRKFKGEEYMLDFSLKLSGDKYKSDLLIGIESRADKRWPTKQWDKYEQLAEILEKDGLRPRFFKQRDRLQEYIRDLSECDLIITGDTLALHVAIALGIKSVSIFTCTSSVEIYGYGRTLKIISPLLDKAFYSRRYIREAVEAVSLESVYEAVKKMINYA